MGRLLMSSSSIATRHGLAVPTELMMFFKSLVAIEGLGRKIDPQFDPLAIAIEFSGEMVKKQFDPAKMAGDMSQIVRESRHLINSLPRQLSMLIRKANSPQHAFKLNLQNMDELKRSLENSFSLLVVGIVTASMIVSASMSAQHTQLDSIQDLPVLSLILYSLAGALGLVGFYHYIRKP